jgi:hypothetical protein
MATSKSGFLIVDDEPYVRTSLSLEPPIAGRSSLPKIITESDNPADISMDVAIWRGLLLIEPDMDVLSAEALLLTNSNYSVTTAFSQRGIFILRDTATVALAIISDALGSTLLNAAAETVR